MLADKLIPHIDTVLRTLFAPAATSGTSSITRLARSWMSPCKMGIVLLA